MSYQCNGCEFFGYNRDNDYFYCSWHVRILDYKRYGRRSWMCIDFKEMMKNSIKLNGKENKECKRFILSENFRLHKFDEKGNIKK